MVLIAALQLVTIGALVIVLFARERDHQNHLGDVLGLDRQERAEHARVLERLCQRIQAPEQAVTDHAVTQTVVPPQPRAVHPDVDSDFWATRMTKEELADYEAGLEMAGVA